MGKRSKAELLRKSAEMRARHMKIRAQRLELRHARQELAQVKAGVPDEERLREDWVRGQVTLVLLQKAMFLLKQRHELDPVAFNLAAEELSDNFSDLLRHYTNTNTTPKENKK